MRDARTAKSPHAKSVTSEFEIHNTLRSLPKGAGSGPGTDSIDFLRAAMTQEVGSSIPGLQLLSLTFDILLHGNLPKSVRPFFADNYSMILHKDLTNLDKLRPIGMGGALRRIFCAHVVRQNTGNFATALAPFNYAIGVPGGMDFVIHTALLQFQKYAERSGCQCSQGNTPTRVSAFIDFENMFNSLSRDFVRDILLEDFPWLLNTFDLLSQLRPADIMIETTGNSSYQRACLDINTGVKPFPLDYAPLPSMPHPTTPQVTLMHEKAEIAKLKGPRRNPTRNHMTGETLIQTLLDRQCMLIPCTLDQHGQMGPLYRRLLHGTTAPHAPQRIDPGPLHPATTEALRRALSEDSPQGLLPTADAKWDELVKEFPNGGHDTWYTYTCHATRPSQWASQVLGFSITTALGQHFRDATRAIRRATHEVRSNTHPNSVPFEQMSVMNPRTPGGLSQTTTS